MTNEVAPTLIPKPNRFVTTDNYSEMLAEQNGVCAICQQPPKNGKRFHRDHDHQTGWLRGLLCPRCNSAVGFVETTDVEKVLDYLDKYERVNFETEPSLYKRRGKEIAISDYLFDEMDKLREIDPLTGLKEPWTQYLCRLHNIKYHPRLFKPKQESKTSGGITHGTDSKIQ